MRSRTKLRTVAAGTARVSKGIRLPISRRIVCTMMSIVLVIGLMPGLAYAGEGGGTSADTAANGASTALTTGAIAKGADKAPAVDGAVEPDRTDEPLAASEADLSSEALSLQEEGGATDQFYFQDVQTNEIATTLHTSGTYRLVDANGALYADGGSWLSVNFELMGSSAREEGVQSYLVQAKAVDENDDSVAEYYVMEDLSEDEWALPSGLYRIKLGSAWDSDYLAQRYRVVNDGLFHEYYFGFDPSYGGVNNHEFSVKPYAAGKSDEDYDGSTWEDDGSGSAVYHDNTPEMEPYALASDARVKFWISSAANMAEGAMPQLESIALWRADEDLETLTGGKYAGADRNGISRVDALRQQADPPLDGVPSWPNYLNFNDDSKLSYLWERGDGDLGERVVLSQWQLDTYGSATDAAFIIDQANFSNTAAEDGLYFPVVTVTIAGEAYTYAYFPIEVDATGVAGRVDPKVVTESLPNAREGAEYDLALKGRSGVGAGVSSTFAWTVTAGALPAGLSLDAATGVLSGTPAAAGEFVFSVTLSEDLGGSVRTATRDFALRVGEAVNAQTAFDNLSLGKVEYTPGTVWLANRYGVSTYVNLRIPISLDLRDESLDLGETELWYMLQIATDHDNDDLASYYVINERAADLMSEDGTALEVPAPVDSSWKISGSKELLRIRAFLIPKRNDGSLAFDPGELTGDGTYSDGTHYEVEPIWATLSKRYGTKGLEEQGAWAWVFLTDSGTRTLPFGDLAIYNDLPEMPYAAVENPDIVFGSHLRFSPLSLEGDASEWPVSTGRVRIWPYDGTTIPKGQIVSTFDVGSAAWNYTAQGADFRLAPGTYAFTVEGEVPTYDEYGVEDGTAWVDIAGSVPGARSVRGTYPQQYLVSIGPNEGSETEPKLTGVVLSDANVVGTESHAASVLFEQEDGSFAAADVEHETNWYRRAGADESSDVLVATGDYVLLGPSDYPLYVEVTAKGRDAAFWKTSGRQFVSDKNHTVSIDVPRKALFGATFDISCESGRTPEPGYAWGIIEVKTPLAEGGYTSFNVWVNHDDNPAHVPNITSGSIITFTPSVDLYADEVTYTVPEDATADFSENLVAPLPKGMVSFEGLSFTDAEGSTELVSLDDGYTNAKVERYSEWGGGSWLSVPYRLADGSHLVLQPEPYYGNYFLSHEARYRVTVTHRDSNAPARMGGEATDYAAMGTFETVLSPEQTSANIDAATIVSRGYADIELDNPGDKACTLLLYRETGDDSIGELVDKGAAGTASQLRTPFLDAGEYRLYAVDASRVPGNKNYYANIQNLEYNAQYFANRISGPLEFSVTDGVISKPDALVFPNWNAVELVDRSQSSVSATSSYTDNVTVSMHAVLNYGATLTDDAYLEISTNQASGESGEGYMNPKALNLNGRAVALNRWGGLFAQTQNMNEGSLRIMLSEAGKINPACAKFPMDMTLVIPRSNMAYTEASVWLVSNGGAVRSLVGTYREDLEQVSLVAPSAVAWQTFYVYGETTPWADVSVYLNGMRAATATADGYGYYTAEVTLPQNVADFDMFTLSAVAQWTRGEEGHVLTSEAKQVMYTTSFPVLERITMCYQSRAGEPYNNITTYYRGKNPNRYQTLYRAENEKNSGNDADHAKYFWLVEFANGDPVDGIDASVPRSDGSVKLTSSDKLKTAEAWIDDVQLKVRDENSTVKTTGSVAGALVRAALTSNDLHSFVTGPTYFSYSPDELEVEIKLKEYDDVLYDMMGADDLGPYAGFGATGLVTADLATYIGGMAESGYGRLCSAADVSGLAAGSTLNFDSLSSATDRATSLMGQAGNVDEWMLLGAGAREVDGEMVNPLLKVHHTVTTDSFTQSDLDGMLDPALETVDAFEAWACDGKDKTAKALKYKGKDVWLAAGTQIIGDESDLYYIVTADGTAANANAQVEMMEKFFVEHDGNPTGKYIYQYTRMDKSTLTRITFDEQNGQRTEVTLAVSPDQVPSGAVSFTQLSDQWDAITSALGAACRAGADALSTDGGSGLGGQSEPEDLGVLTMQGPVGEEVKGNVISNAINYAIDYIWPRRSEQDSATDKQMSRQRNGLNDLDPQKLARRSEKGYMAEQVGYAMNDMRNIVQPAAVNSGVMVGTGGPSSTTVPSTILTPGVQANQSWLQRKFAGLLEDPDDVANVEQERKRQAELERLYKQFKEVQIRKKYKLPLTGAYNLHRLLDPKTAKKFSIRYLAETGQLTRSTNAQNKVTHDPSGIVYEAVLSNPVAGATVKLYTYSKAAGKAGFEDPGMFVDSMQFGIEDNPQITGADGRYQWFVPEGYWQVRVTKDGYEPVSTGNSDAFGIDATKTLYAGTEDEVEASTYWMPVLPVQLDVNIPLVSKEAPAVASTEVVPEGAVVEFSKYVDAATVKADLFALAVDGVQAEIVGVRPLDAEEAADGSLATDGSPKMLATRYLVVLDESAQAKIWDADSVSVALADPSGSITSYAGTALAEESRAMNETVAVPDLSEFKTDLSGATVGLAASSLVYNGAEQKPAVKSVTVGGKTLHEGDDFAVSYADGCTNVGTYKVTLTGKGAYEGEASASFSIKAASLASASVSGVEDKAYKGTALTQSPTVKVGALTLTEGADYTLTYKDNVNAGTATMTIAGKGNFSGSLSKTFAIRPASLAAASVSGIAAKTYAGAALTQSPTVKVGATTLKAGVDYTLSYKDNVNAGIATMTITGAGNYAGSVAKTFAIAPKAVMPTVALGKQKLVFNGKAQKPVVTVKVDGKQLAAAQYTVSYLNAAKKAIAVSNVKNVGAYWAKVTLKGNYAGSKQVAFKIVPKATKLGKLKAASKGFVAKWKKRAKQTKGYQLQYSPKKKFKSAKTVTVKGAKKTTKKIGKLKPGKKYWVRVRTYKKVGKVTFYSAWSKAKTVTTKK